MNNRNLIQEIYTVFINDEILLRLLHYPAKNQRDNPLDKTKPSILDLPPVDRFKIIDNVIYTTDKKLELDLDDKFNRINVYLGNSIPKRVYSSGAKQLINNPYISDQEVIIDINASMSINKVDWRLQWIMDRVNYLLQQKDVRQFTKLKFNEGYPINITAKGFVGHRLVYYTSIPQQQSNKGWDLI